MKACLITSIAIACSFVSATEIRAQYSAESPQSVGFEFYLSSGGATTLGNNVSMADMLSVMPDSEILRREYPGFSSFSDNFNFAGNTSIGATFNPFLKDDGSRKRIKLRPGFTRFNSDSHGLSISRTDQAPFDTLVSGTSDRTLVVDSVRDQNLYANIGAQHYYLDLGVQFDSQWRSRWQGYVGANISLGIILAREARVYLYDQRYINFEDERFSGTDDNFEEEVRALPNAFGFMAGISAGLSWQVASEHPFWSRVSLFGEWRPSMHISQVPELGTYVTPISFSHFGLRIRA